MSTPATTRKRARTDAGPDEERPPENSANVVSADGTADAPPALTRDADFWFDDGTVILVAGTVEFRVYKGLLANHSSVLKEMFANPHDLRQLPSDDGSGLMTCPYIRLSDSPHELRHLLRVLMPVRDSALVIPMDCSFDMISAYIRLGKKYHITHLYDQSMQFLRNHFTTDFDVWVGKDTWTPRGWNEICAIGVVNLARLTGESTLLPTAFLVCVAARLDDELVRGFAREDGSHENLTLDDLGLCYRAISCLREASITAILRTFSASPPSVRKTSPYHLVLNVTNLLE